MEPNLCLSSPKALACTHSPIFLPYKAPFLENSGLSVKSHLSFPSKQAERTQFFGQGLILREKNAALVSSRKAHVPFHPIRAFVKRRKELPFDNVIQRDKKLKLVLRIRHILLSQPDRIMSLQYLGRFRRHLGIKKKRRFTALLKKFPAVFQIVEEGAFSLKFKLTPEAERLYLEELKARNEMEDLAVVKLRKLLMMSAEKRILLEKIAHWRTDFGLPFEFRDTICRRYPHYFKVVPTARGNALELTHWDPRLAVSAAELYEEEKRARVLEEKNLIIDRPLKFNRINLPKGLNLPKDEMKRICRFRDTPYMSPYSDFSGLRSGTMEKEKHACGVVHEILSLTIEKRTLVDHFTHFREEFKFSQQLRGMLIRHPDMFYVSLKGDRDSVFLRDAYHDSQLIEKDRRLLIKEKFRALVEFPKRSAHKSDIDGVEGSDNPEGGSAGEEEEEWSDVDTLLIDGLDEEEEYDDDDDEADYEDDWSDEDDDMPPDFYGDDRTPKLESDQMIKQAKHLTKNEEKVLVPAFPDGRRRERW
ncbi:protein WHAT'S THIS FACTOR 1 homolog, chloroplastic [Malania oleifera]|uniref:protein WHAT'S THIS FACTOR 1 homolog, chloroplastic n=1 Tax=Malania oleifera TaxID=397392 RepID=UPI0025ADF620|nr:protein WHAT'S THIS FACTOR 1 homolog, chloroplastic [Malania oleifera]